MLPLSLCLTGCSLSRPALNKQSFAFINPPLTNAPAGNHTPWLGIRRVSVAAPFDSQSFVYRTGDFSYERDPYAEFLASPAEVIQAPLRACLTESGAFRGVVEPGSSLTPGVLLEVTVEQLYGDFRNRSSPAAVLEMSFVFFDAPTGIASKVLLERTYRQRVPLQARTAAALVAGWNQGLKEILQRVENDWRAAQQR